VGIDWNAELVDQRDSHWRRRLRPSLEGLTDDESPPRPEPVTRAVDALRQLLDVIRHGAEVCVPRDLYLRRGQAGV
jgi:hypothetical protein